MKKICITCNKPFSTTIKNGDKIIHSIDRKRCLDCFPFKHHYSLDKNKSKSLSDAKKRHINKYVEKWSIYLKARYGENPKCEICNKELQYFSNNNGNSVHFDHTRPNVAIMIKPKTWLKSTPCIDDNIKIWESCSFGILCRNCNFRLPSLNREQWLDRVLKYIKRYIEEYHIG